VAALVPVLVMLLVIIVIMPVIMAMVIIVLVVASSGSPTHPQKTEQKILLEISHETPSQ